MSLLLHCDELPSAPTERQRETSAILENDDPAPLHRHHYPRRCGDVVEAETLHIGRFARDECWHSRTPSATRLFEWPPPKRRHNELHPFIRAFLFDHLRIETSHRHLPDDSVRLRLITAVDDVAFPFVFQNSTGGG